MSAGAPPMRTPPFIQLPSIFGALLCLFFSACSPKQHADEPAVRAHLERYFTTWSAQDMDGYSATFHPQARITFLKGQQPSTQGLTDFLHEQRMMHQIAAAPMKEFPLQMDISIAKNVATAVVKWELHRKEGNITGTDFFTLARTAEGWRIVTLVWEQD